MKEKTFRILLASISGVMLGFAYPPVPTGITSIVAFVSLFILFETITSYGRVFRYSYLTFFIFNLIGMYWAGGFTHCKDLYMMIAGGLLLIAHPFFFYVPIAVWMLIRRNLSFKFSILTFPFLWVGFEFIHSSTEIGFPWLTLGNTQTYDNTVIQFASITGIFGISFWILLLSVSIFLLYSKITSKEWKWFSAKFILSLIGIIVLYFLPKIYGYYVINNSTEIEVTTIKVAILQPNIDPFQKWSDKPELSLDVIQQQTNDVKDQQIDLVIWPETAIPFYILHPNNYGYFRRIKVQVDTLNINLLTGIPDIHYYKSTDNAPKSSKISVRGERYETYNSSMLVKPHSDEIQKYAKIVLVPFAERVPFSEELSFLNAMEWNFGLGGWGVGKDTTVFSFTTKKDEKIKLSNMICYESVIPGFVAGFVRKGAQFLTIITNDSWWGNTSGAYQHKQYAVLRAVENRRWIVQCANGGISCIIDPLGRILQQSTLYTQITMCGEIGIRNDLTFYTKNGDWFAELMLVFSAIFITSVLGNKFYRYIRKRNENGIH